VLEAFLLALNQLAPLLDGTPFAREIEKPLLEVGSLAFLMLG
jgi:hypothetical protein